MSGLCQDNVNCHMCHMSMSLTAKTDINTIEKVQVITPHGARQQFGMLIFVYLSTAAVTHPYASAPPALTMLTLPLRPQDMPPTPPSPLLMLPPTCRLPSLCPCGALQM
ncbi:hypothetical protein O181_046738 [Austropuccinia psidii MF-1]|uniref:Uncharacterized protein n=1 Tax=Austropuccinia psidii MF-1 TaxID=1389203 RepID=A0A9Q3HIU7_9BASI|nr:hypothetical protein [Austropuccinia psidii MF-1]